MRQIDWDTDSLLKHGRRLEPLMHSLLEDAPALGVVIHRQEASHTLLDCGIDAPGSWEVGRRLVEICHGGMAHASIDAVALAGRILPRIIVDSWLPARSTLGLQLSLPLSEVSDAIRVSGPIRALFDALPEARRRAPSHWRIAVVETSQRPSPRIVEAIATRARISANDLTLIVVPPYGPSGSAQIAGRGNESVMLTLQESLGIDADCVSQIAGSAPIAPSPGHGKPGSSPLLPDDFIHYAGCATVSLRLPSERSIAQVAHQLTFRSSVHYGRLFADMLRDAGGVFEKIPDVIHLNKIGQITLNDVLTGDVASAGSTNARILADAWTNDTSHPQRTPS